MLEKLSLSALAGNGKFDEQFTKAVDAVQRSLNEDKDIQGERSITVKLAFKNSGHGDYVNTDITVSQSVPKRKLKTIGIVEHGELRIDSYSGNAQQPSMLDPKISLMQASKSIEFESNIDPSNHTLYIRKKMERRQVCCQKE